MGDAATAELPGELVQLFLGFSAQNDSVGTGGNRVYNRFTRGVDRLSAGMTKRKVPTDDHIVVRGCDSVFSDLDCSGGR